jgi:hypothetical protein
MCVTWITTGRPEGIATRLCSSNAVDVQCLPKIEQCSVQARLPTPFMQPRYATNR